MSKESLLMNRDRRRFITQLSAAGVLALGNTAFAIEPPTGRNGPQTVRQPPSMPRRERAAQLRQEAARACQQMTPADLAHPTNGDEERYPNKIASYSKGLKHFSNGEVDPASYETLMTAINSGNPTTFDALAVGGNLKLTNPQAGLAFDLEGGDSHSFVQPPPPAFASRELA